MRMLRKIALLAALCGGCVVVHDNNPPPPPPPQGPPLYQIDPGASTVIYPGQQAGFGITANVGGSYRMVWTGDSAVQYTNFRGSVYTPGHFSIVNPGCNGGCPVESSDFFTAPQAVSGGGEEFTFDTVATTGIDGVDFVVSLEPVEFDLTIDGARYPSLVFFTSNGADASPATIPFDLTTR
jgi:hypothetical protein